MPLPLIFRTTDMLKWGAGKGTNLTPIEVDENFWTLWQFLTDLTSEPLQPNNIASISVAGNQMTIHMDDASTFGPFTLPVAAFGVNPAGLEWQPGIEYAVWEIFTANDGLYLVAQAHTSESEFDPDDGNINGPFARLLLPFPNLYDIGFSFPGTPGLGITDGEAMFTFRANRPFYLLADLPGSVAGLERSAAALMTFPIYKNRTQIGTLSIGGLDSVTESESEAESDFVWTFAADVQFVAGDRLRVLRPTTGLDANARDLSINFAGRKGTLS